MCADDFDPADVWTETQRRARVRHVCSECLVDILPGESYVCARWLADGYWSSAKRCWLCVFLVAAIETILCGGHGQILWGGQQLAEEIANLGDELEFAWAREAFAAIQDRIFA
jgi:hypothetical protein